MMTGEEEGEDGLFPVFAELSPPSDPPPLQDTKKMLLNIKLPIGIVNFILYSPVNVSYMVA